MTDLEKQIFISFLDSHTDIFTPFQRMYLESYMDEDIKRLYPVPDGLREVLAEAGLLSERQNSYKGFIRILQETFKLDGKRIKEIGGGFFPIVTEELGLIPGIKEVVVFDPNIYRDRHDNGIIKYVRRKVSRYDDDIDCDLLIGFKPCKGAEVIVAQAVKTNTDFMIALCEGGAHGDEDDYFVDEEEWLESLLYEAEIGCRDAGMGKVKKKSLRNYGDRYPIIYNDRFCTY